MRKMLFTTMLCLLAAMQSIVAKEEINSAVDSISEAFKIVTNAPQEKVFLHTDKPYYFQGDTIWIKGYLTGAITHKMNSFSRNLYVELIDKKNKLLTRQLIERIDDSFVASIPIDVEQPEGDYYLRAYTKWMQNFDSGFMYVQNIQINHNSALKCKISLRQEVNDNIRDAIITLTDPATKSGMENVDVKCIVGISEKDRKYTTHHSNRNGEVRVSLPKGNVEKTVIEIIASKNDWRVRRILEIPAIMDFHVDFFPEGGKRIAGCSQKIAFKAIGTSGLSENITGTVISAEGDTLTTFESAHAGMGAFFIDNSENSECVVFVKNADGIEHKYEIEKPSQRDVALTINQAKDRIIYKLLKPENYTGLEPKYMMIHVRGKLISSFLIEGKEVGQLNVNLLPEGIAHFIVTDKSFTPLSERLVYVGRNDAELSFNSTNGELKPRKLMKFIIDATDENKNRLKGNFSLSVTDCYSVELDSLSENIRSYMLLSSDLKGHIENPGFYFRHKDNRTSAYLDYLMMTQGWTRFDIDNILHFKSPDYLYPIERGQSLSGKVKNGFGKTIKNTTVIALIPKLHKSYYTKTDDEGRFILDNLRFPQHSTMRVQASKKNKLSNYFLQIDNPEYPEMFNPHPFSTKISSIRDTYIQELEKGYTSVNGQRVVHLPEISITGTGSRYENYAAHTWDEDKVEQTKVKNALELLRQMPGLHTSPNGDLVFAMAGGHMRSENEVRPQDKDRPMTFGSVSPKALRPKIYLDNRQIQTVDLEQIKADDIKYVSLIDPETDQTLSEAVFDDDNSDDALYNEALLETTDEDDNTVSLRGRTLQEQLTKPATGRIMITSKTGNLIIQDETNQKALTLMPLGYSVAKRFYSPKYEVKEEFAEADVRSTVYWAPVIKTDGTQPVTVEFYASDRTEGYNYVIEGITDDGRVCHASGTLH
ncbi:MAG: carboxypeptidase-like regulatory domain-containing protein [Lachnospiraceae bacterium]|nr:carboxypeptidase-like regulatory domain-containing protein [Lachnospiraceae bacterium]